MNALGTMAFKPNTYEYWMRNGDDIRNVRYKVVVTKHGGAMDWGAADSPLATRLERHLGDSWNGKGQKGIPGILRLNYPACLQWTIAPSDHSRESFEPGTYEYWKEHGGDLHPEFYRIIAWEEDTGEETLAQRLKAHEQDAVNNGREVNGHPVTMENNPGVSRETPRFKNWIIEPVGLKIRPKAEEAEMTEQETELKIALAQLRADMARFRESVTERISRLIEAIAERDREAAKREAQITETVNQRFMEMDRRLLWVVGFIIAAITLGVVIISTQINARPSPPPYVITLPAPAAQEPASPPKP